MTDPHASHDPRREGARPSWYGSEAGAGSSGTGSSAAGWPDAPTAVVPMAEVAMYAVPTQAKLSKALNSPAIVGSAVAMIESEPPSSMLRAAPKKRLGG